MQALLGFVNFKLYHALELSYPPPLDRCAPRARVLPKAADSALRAGCRGPRLLDDDAAGVLAVRTTARDGAGAGAQRADDAAELDATLQQLGHASVRVACVRSTAGGGMRRRVCTQPRRG